MEPADQGRDDPCPGLHRLTAEREPQWSPPINGGMTPVTDDELAEVPAAMEPADQRRDDW